MTRQTEERLGPYRLVGLLGRGGMGEVWLAERDGTQPGRVALKVLRGTFAATAGVAERFAREIETLRRLDHPGIVAARGELGQEGDVHYYPMELVIGRDLQALLLGHGALETDQAIGLACQVLEALAAAHRLGVVHRDVKPANVLVDREGNARLTDFGLAQVADRSRLTAEDSILGTPAYLSPEQARGETATEQSDLYSVGALLYELLSGRPPFQAKNPVALLRQHIDDEPPSLAEAVPHLPLQLCEHVHRALRKNPSDRFATADAMATALRSVLGPEQQAAAVSASTAILREHVAHALRSTEVLSFGVNAEPTARRSRGSALLALSLVGAVVGLIAYGLSGVGPVTVGNDGDSAQGLSSRTPNVSAQKPFDVGSLVPSPGVLGSAIKLRGQTVYEGSSLDALVQGFRKRGQLVAADRLEVAEALISIQLRERDSYGVTGVRFSNPADAEDLFAAALAGKVWRIDDENRLEALRAGNVVVLMLSDDPASPYGYARCREWIVERLATQGEVQSATTLCMRPFRKASRRLEIPPGYLGAWSKGTHETVESWPDLFGCTRATHVDYGGGASLNAYFFTREKEASVASRHMGALHSKGYLLAGGSVLVVLTASGETPAGLSAFLEDWVVATLEDCVDTRGVRTRVLPPADPQARAALAAEVQQVQDIRERTREYFDQQSLPDSLLFAEVLVTADVNVAEAFVQTLGASDYLASNELYAAFRGAQPRFGCVDRAESVALGLRRSGKGLLGSLNLQEHELAGAHFVAVRVDGVFAPIEFLLSANLEVKGALSRGYRSWKALLSSHKR
jgi:serine/threonine protein kinase